MTGAFVHEPADASAFECALGRLHGRVLVDGTWKLVLGSLDSEFRGDVAPGDFVEVAQEVDLTDAALVRVQGEASCPTEAGVWELTIRVDDEARVRVALGARSRPLDDVVAPIADVVGVHRLAIRLTRTG